MAEIENKVVEIEGQPEITDVEANQDVAESIKNNKKLQKQLKRLAASRAGQARTMDARQRLRQKLAVKRAAERPDAQQNWTKHIGQAQKSAKKKRNKHKEKMKKMNKKYGPVSFERYSQALEIVNSEKEDRDQIEINHENNIVSLYLWQNPKTQEVELDISDEDSVSS